MLPIHSCNWQFNYLSLCVPFFFPLGFWGLNIRSVSQSVSGSPSKNKRVLSQPRKYLKNSVSRLRVPRYDLPCISTGLSEASRFTNVITKSVLKDGKGAPYLGSNDVFSRLRDTRAEFWGFLLPQGWELGRFTGPCKLCFGAAYPSSS